MQLLSKLFGYYRCGWEQVKQKFKTQQKIPTQYCSETVAIMSTVPSTLQRIWGGSALRPKPRACPAGLRTQQDTSKDMSDNQW